MTYLLFFAEPRPLEADDDECSVSNEPGQAPLHELSDHTAVLFAGI